MSRYTKANHRIFMQFVRREVWHVTFLEPRLQTPLPKTLTFTDEGKIRELARRAAGHRTTVAKKFEEARKAASVPESIVLYCARHEFATTYLENGGELNPQEADGP
jgi:hypothetical protein